MRGPELSILDLPNLARGFRFTLKAMLSETSNVNLIKLVPALQMPVFFFLGRHDRWVPPETSVAYFNMLTAPSKLLVWFDESGHEPFVDEADKFNASMADLVRTGRWLAVGKIASAFRPYHPVVRHCSEVMVSAISCTKLDVASKGAAWPAPSI